jgi:hypothetical protein
VGLNQSGQPPNYTLRLTLMNGQELGGPFDGVVTGPNGFSCTLSLTGKTGACPPATFPAGTTVPLVVTLTRFVPDDRAIWQETGCDSITASPTTRSVETCFVNMNSDRDITIAIGCDICAPDIALDGFLEPQRPPRPGTEPLRRPEYGADRGLWW